ncbi:unnamed protein product [Diamesa serratosioi]
MLMFVICFVTISIFYQKCMRIEATSEIGKTTDELQEFLDAFNKAQPDLKWIRDEYQFQYETDGDNNGDLQRHRKKRDENTIQINPNDLKSLENGDTWYKNYRSIECQLENNSDKSFCEGFHSKKSEQVDSNLNMQRQPNLSAKFDELQSGESKWNTEMKEVPQTQQGYSASGTDDDDINNKQFNSNYDMTSSKLQARFNAKKFMERERMKLTDIESGWKQQKYNSPVPSVLGVVPKMSPSDNQLMANDQNASNFNYNFDMDSRMENIFAPSLLDKRSLSKSPPIHYNDQLSKEKNDLFQSEANSKLSKKEQDQKQPQANRELKRDVDGKIKLKISNKLMQQGLSAELPSDVYGFEDSFSNIKRHPIPQPVPELNENYQFKKIPNYNRFKRENSNRNLMSNKNMEIKIDENGTILKAKINPEINTNDDDNRQTTDKSTNNDSEIPTAVHKMVESSEKLKNHIKPYLQEPKYTKLKDPSKLNSIKSNEMMNDLVGSINDLIEDQIQMRTCIPLSPELKEFYETLMGKKMDNIEEQHEDDYEQDYKENVKQFVTPKKRLIRNIVKVSTLINSFNHFILFLQNTNKHLSDKYKTITRLQTMLNKLPIEDENMKTSIGKYLNDHLFLLDAIKYKENLNQQELQHIKRQIEDKSSSFSSDFAKLFSFQNYMRDVSLENF